MPSSKHLYPFLAVILAMPTSLGCGLFAVDRETVRQATLELRGASTEEEALAAEEKLRETRNNFV